MAHRSQSAAARDGAARSCHTVLDLTAFPGVPVGATVLSAGRNRGGGMSFGSGPDAGAGAGSADPRDLPGGLLASAADRDAAQAILEAAFAEQRLTQEEFAGRAEHARQPDGRPAGRGRPA